MNIMLADSIDGGIFVILVLLGCAVTSLLALIALVPAIKRNGVLTGLLVSPAIIAVIGVTVWVGSGFFTGGRSFPDGPLSDYFAPWLMCAGLPLATSCTALLVLWFRKRTRPPAESV